MERLVSALKITQENLRVLHRNIHGKDFFTAHNLLEDYYRTVGDMTDSIIEIFMSLGFTEPSMEKSCKSFDSLSGGRITVPNALALVRDMFLDLMSLMDKAKETLPHDISDMLEEHKRWLRLEANYKIARLLNIFE